MAPLGCCLLAAGLAAFGSGCATRADSGCPDGTTCITLDLMTDGMATGSPVVIDDLELIVRVADTTRRVRFDDRVVSAPGELPLALPELDGNSAQRIAIYARARSSTQAPPGQDLGAVVLRAAAEALQPHYPLDLQRACVGPPCVTPEPRRGATLNLDPHSRHLVLFGGRRQDGTPLSDTWEWDGIGWQRIDLPAASAPSPRAGHTVALDERRGNLLLFGGAGGEVDAPQPLADTWEYLGAPAGWQQLAAGGPPARHQAAMASSQVTLLSNGANLTRPPGVLLFGGLDTSGHTLGDTWLWDGAKWYLPANQSDPCPDVAPAVATLPRCRSMAALIPAAAPGASALLIGGRLGPLRAGTAQAPEFDQVIWRWDGSAWSVAPLARPPELLARFGHYAGLAAASDLAMVAFGDSASGLRQDTLVLDLATGLLSPQLGPAPAPRAEAAVAYDDERDEVVLLGGRGEHQLYFDTWSFTMAQGWRPHY